MGYCYGPNLNPCYIFFSSKNTDKFDNQRLDTQEKDKIYLINYSKAFKYIGKYDEEKNET